MKVLIPFSSGLDSTYLVYKTLKEGHEVDVVYFTLKNNYTKIKLEDVHRRAIIKELQKEFQGRINESYLDYNLELAGLHNERTLIQPVIWAFGIYNALKRGYDKVYMSYVLGDHCVSYLEELQTLYKAYQPFTDLELPKLEFPIIKLHKSQIWDQLPYQYRKLVYSCEEPIILKDENDVIEYKPCHRCHACTTNHEMIGNNCELITSNRIICYHKDTNEFTTRFDSEEPCEICEKASPSLESSPTEVGIELKSENKMELEIGTMESVDNRDRQMAELLLIKDGLSKRLDMVDAQIMELKDNYIKVEEKEISDVKRR